MNKTDLAIALGYGSAGEDLPRVIASGRGAIARQMLAIAEHHGVARGA
ncbi:MAG TPA: EscU/YscU/HrcU family type III secretion system export apparatus switch protein [Geminicoccaceae bacterium]